MDPAFRSALVDMFRRGEVTREIRLLAAQGALAPRAHEQVALLVLLADDPDSEIAARTRATLDGLPLDALRAFLARGDVPSEIRDFFARRGVQPASNPADDVSEPLVDTLFELPETGEEEAPGTPKVLANLPIMDRIKLAMKGTREQRAQLIRDSNRMVAAAVLSSPKLTDAEVETFAKMANVSDEVLRVIASNRSWLKNYGVVLGLAKNPKTPPAISMQLLQRLNERDVKMLATDRNIPEALRLAARRITAKARG
ncbi:MAG TPA: hypothetical protein VD833_08590 [Vicinamibacterales bacterium]|nr:hypothetical protein [Vicinamibacterales bacterium]